MRSKLVRLLAAAIIGLAGSFVVVAVSAAPAQADACYTWNRVLKRGMSGSDVAQLQIRLAGWMTYGTNLAIDGAFGPATEGALKRFQSGYGLGVDGIAGSQTYSKIYSLQDADCTPIHFSHSEFNYNCGARNYNGGNVSAAQARENVKRVMWQLEALRRKLGDRPLVISSGFRSVSCDKAVGGSGSGRHTYGQAADMSWRSGPTQCQIASAVRYAGFEGMFGPGYPGHNDHVHADNRGSRAWSAPNCGI